MRVYGIAFLGRPRSACAAGARETDRVSLASPRHADVLMVTGPVTKNMREALERTYNSATPDPKWVVAVGDCAGFAGGVSAKPFLSRVSAPADSTRARLRCGIDPLTMRRKDTRLAPPRCTNQKCNPEGRT